MKPFVKDIKLHIVTLIIFGFVFPLIIWFFSLGKPTSALGNPVYQNGKIVGFENIGQNFHSDGYFWGRPSAVNYNAAGSGGSNKGTSNPEYLLDIQSRIDSFLMHNPGVSKSEIPSDLVTASGSGIDPHISVQSAKIQIKRTALCSNLSEIKLNQLLEKHIEKPLLGLLGTERINVLKLNIDLDNIK